MCKKTCVKKPLLLSVESPCYNVFRFGGMLAYCISQTCEIACNQ